MRNTLLNTPDTHCKRKAPPVMQKQPLILIA